mgnify:CR=1 FL=1
MAISSEWGTAADKANYFGRVDYQENLNRGYDALQILNYLNQNRGKLRGPDVPGGGGVYDIVSRDARALQQTRDQRQAQQNQIQQFQTQIANQAELLSKQQAMAAQQQEEYRKSLQQAASQGSSPTADVRMAKSRTAEQGLTRRGTTGYFGRQGLRIGSLNVPSMGMMISPTNKSMSGSFA